MTQYAEFMEEFLEPQDKDKIGRYHSLLEEVIYPFDYENLGWRCWQTQMVNEAKVYPGPRTPEYHWWMYFDNFSIWGLDMVGTLPLES